MASSTTERRFESAARAPLRQSRGDLVGRREALGVLGEMVDEIGCAVVVGPPGVGKTRLVEAFVEQRRQRTSAPPWLWFDLADAPPLRQIVETASHTRAAGIVLDGAERLDDTSHLAALRRAAPRAALVVTSRRRLAGVRGEHLRLEGLDVEAGVELFRQRARRSIADADLSAVRRLVRRLDGLPWPIALAADRTEVMSPTMLLERLDAQFELFGSRSLDRDESFTQAVTRAWDDLDAAAHTCLSHCSIFADSFSLEAAEYVVELPGPVGTVEILGRLLDSSWLRSLPTSGGQTRFEWWESLRVFALRRLEESGRRQRAERAYVEFFESRSLQLSETVESPSGLEAVEQLRRDSGHLLRVADLLLDSDPARAAGVLWALRWNARLGDDAEAVAARLDRLADGLDPNADPGWGARVEMLRGELALRQGRTELASDRLERALGLANAAGDLVLRARVARASSMSLAHVDLDAAEQRLREALELAAQARQPAVEGGIRERLGFLQLQTFRLEEARQSFRRARKLLSAHGNALLAAQATTGLAYVALRTGHRTGAASAFEETVRIYASIRDRRREAEARFNLGVALHAEARLERAVEQYERALDLWDRCAESRYETIARARLGLAMAELGAPGAAAQSFQEAIATGQRNGDWHNRAIAEAAQVMLELLDEGLTARISELQRALEEMHFAGDPDAAAASLGVLAISHAARRQPDKAAETLQRIVALRSLVASQDTALLDVIDGLLAVGHRWADRVLAGHGRTFEAGGVTALHEDNLVRFVPSIFDDPQRARAEAARLHNPYLRLLFAGFIDQAADAGGSTTYLTAARPDGADAILVVHRDGHWFQIGDEPPVSLLSRQPLRLLLRAIITSHVEDDAPGQSVGQLIEHGWPDEVLTKSAGSNRVYTAIRLLRDMGLDDILVTGNAGYRFAEQVAVELSEETRG